MRSQRHLLRDVFILTLPAVGVVVYLVVATAASQPVDGHFEARLAQPLELQSPSWLALRTPPPPTGSGADNPGSFPINALGRHLFSHTSPIYVHMGGRIPFQRPAAAKLLDTVQQNRKSINRNALFADDQERSRVLRVYTEAAERLRQHMRRHTPQ